MFQCLDDRNYDSDDTDLSLNDEHSEEYENLYEVRTRKFVIQWE